MVSFLAALCALAAILTVSSAKDYCTDNVRQGSELIYAVHCPIILRLEDPKLYANCIQSHYPYMESCVKCFKEIENIDGKDLDIKRIVQDTCTNKTRTNEQVRQMICCIVTEEVAPSKQNGAYKVDVSRTCLEKLKENGSWPASK